MEESVARVYRFKRVLKYSILALLITIIALFVFEYIRIKPNNVHFTNITSSSVTVSWDTKMKTDATAIYIEPENKLPFLILPITKERFFDTRDITKAELKAVEETANNQEGTTVTMDNVVTEIRVTERGRYYTHHIEIKGLDPEKEYSFMVGDSILFRKVKDINEKVIAKTYAVPESILTPYPAYGAVRDADGYGDVPIEDLPIVSDGVVYFNYYDKVTGERSNLFSSSLNEEGNWYIDVSSAIDDEGKNFFNSYIGGENGLNYELNINLGQLGKWKRTDNAGIISPADIFIINMSNTIQSDDIPGSIVRIDSMMNNLLNNLVKEIFAEEDCADVGTLTGLETSRDCVFLTWCNCGCVANPGARNLSKSCKESGGCSKATLIARNCEGYEDDDPNQENDLCSGGKKVGETMKLGEQCRICKYTTSGNIYARWENADAKKCEDNNNNNNTDKPICGPAHGKDKFTSSVTSIDPRILCKSGTPSPSSVPFPLDKERVDWDCKIGSNVVDCFATRRTDGCDHIVGNPTLGTYCHDCDGCKCPTVTRELDDGDYCPLVACTESRKTIDPGDTCDSCALCNCSTAHNVSKIIADGTLCPEESPEIPEPPETQDDECWVNGRRELYKVEGEKCFKCSDLKWGEVSCDSGGNGVVFQCNRFVTGGGNNCLKHGTFCVKNGDIYKCNGTIWKKTENNSNVSATGFIEKSAGKKCDNPPCICTSGPDEGKKLFNDTSWCRKVDKCNSNTKGQVCKKNGDKCPQNHKGVTWPCGSDSSFLNSKTSVKLISLLFNQSKVFGIEKTIGETFIIDQTTGMISGLEPGSYTFTNNNQTYYFDVSEESLKVNNGNILIFIDKNGNEEYDEGTDIKISTLASEIKISTIEKNYKYNLQEGFNYVSFPFLVSSEDYRTAASLLKQLNSVYGDVIYSISKYDGSWKVVGQNVQVYDNNDFQLLPGQGYIVKAKQDIDITIPGQPVQYESETDSAPITLLKGWNLIGLYGTGVKSYTAKTMIQDINNYTEVDFTADNVSKWDSDVQRYEGYQLTNENGLDFEYGFDYPLDILKSYFLRVNEGTGNWEPELAK